jgi:hypothetical protein
MKTARMLDLGFSAPVLAKTAAATGLCGRVIEISGSRIRQHGFRSGGNREHRRHYGEFNGRRSRNGWLWHQYVAVTKLLPLTLRTQST